SGESGSSIVLVLRAPGYPGMRGARFGVRLRPAPRTSNPMTTRPWEIFLRPDIAEALAWGRPVVALESTLIAHGLPRPDTLALARELEAIVRAEGGVPATVGVIRGEPTVGLTEDELQHIATVDDVLKLSVRDLGP